MEDILKEAILRVLSIPGSTNYGSLLLEISNYHVEVWIDAMKMKYEMKKLHSKKASKLYRVMKVLFLVISMYFISFMAIFFTKKLLSLFHYLIIML